ncbi:hypothetical protein SDC9_142275 [bioreactor metagenome]|uniref:Uncharacterized protein n=1 Tax=bioreactor metagenome TaxID=1076179 RepID=A0A645E012_9ZZZZ
MYFELANDNFFDYALVKNTKGPLGIGKHLTGTGKEPCEFLLGFRFFFFWLRFLLGFLFFKSCLDGLRDKRQLDNGDAVEMNPYR